MTSASTALASEPMSAERDVGNTSYTSLPFQRQAYDLCFNCSPNLAPAELFFEANPQSRFNDPAKMSQTHEDVAGKEKTGIVPSAGVQRWEADAYWTAVAKVYPTLSPADQRKVGQKLLKRLWIWAAWAHAADRSGNVRRAIAFASRDYWDDGKLTALDPLASVIRSVVPAHPFGPALYYSGAVERAIEQAATKDVGTRDEEIPTYLPARDLQALIDGGASVGYYVSDAALPALAKNSAPSAWIVLDGKGLLPADAKAVSGTVQLAKLKASDGPHQLHNLLTGADQPITVSGHTATFPIAVARWDTIVLSRAQS